MKKSLILIALATGCGAADQNNQSTPANDSAAAPAAEPVSPAQTPKSLIGYYEGGSTPNQLCIVEKNGSDQFGMVIWGANLSACGGAGEVERTGDRLRFRMTGDQACTISARMTDNRISLEGPVPAGCSYYCGARIGFEGAVFTRKGSTAADAMRAKDPAGDPLCSN